MSKESFRPLDTSIEINLAREFPEPERLKGVYPSAKIIRIPAEIDYDHPDAIEISRVAVEMNHRWVKIAAVDKCIRSRVLASAAFNYLSGFGATLDKNSDKKEEWCYFYNTDGWNGSYHASDYWGSGLYLIPLRNRQHIYGRLRQLSRRLNYFLSECVDDNIKAEMEREKMAQQNTILIRRKIWSEKGD